MSDLTGPTIPVLVGQETFHLHRNPVVSSSEFFANATKSEWRNDASKPIDLSDEEPPIFECYQQWLYTKKVAMPEDTESAYRVLAALYVLDEKIADQTYQGAVIGAIINLSIDTGSYPQQAAVRRIYQNITTNSLARRLFVDFWAYNAMPGWSGINKLRTATCDEFVDDLIPAMIKARSKPNKKVVRPWVENRDSYYPRVAIEPNEN
ncbi:hypothetical protein P153DRAFT_366621 [Dothidotthia symphoricarpi CBS 119687]|uniref:BTB domain-containing protein n=1 Tax=Dothidotthia symphoricarpi CBS 119687 TaxID=1392245 RepID=A0A6A6AIA7_9PLEO|nr:uncharacterized protein P153DRAFT_366621 [Dothidotthia symphoricarpi CBS 119687]KAF2130161.1 hypothetical protein P153DRAFT_366621 [Dothidotthia symphoricarpi CBS 119687]